MPLSNNKKPGTTDLRLLKARESGHSLCHPRSPVFFLQRRKAKKAPTETAGVLRRLRLRCPTARKSEPSCTSCPSCSSCLRWLRTPVPRGASSASLILRTFVRPPSRVAALPRSSLPLPPFSLPLLPSPFPCVSPLARLHPCVSASLRLAFRLRPQETHPRRPAAGNGSRRRRFSALADKRQVFRGFPDRFRCRITSAGSALPRRKKVFPVRPLFSG